MPTIAMTFRTYRGLSKNFAQGTTSWLKPTTGGKFASVKAALHRYIGNPVLSGIGRLVRVFSAAIFTAAYVVFFPFRTQWLDLRTAGMELASEMVVKAAIRGLRISEVPTTLAPDGRKRRSHLRAWARLLAAPARASDVPIVW